ncbi:hypothetical protein ACFWXK_11760 [Streptomyces sp. NPDC059070]|uniref:hypothetical protein n=1 Tax=unclassified Streptomyces TaxID=2593676 RepID=UPI0034E28FA2
MRRSIWSRLAVIAAAPLIAFSGATAAQAHAPLNTSAYTVWDTTGTCSIYVHFYYNSHWFVEYDLTNHSNGTVGCAAGAYTSDLGYVGAITGGGFSTNDDGSRWVQPYVQRVGNSSTTGWGANR